MRALFAFAATVCAYSTALGAAGFVPVELVPQQLEFGTTLPSLVSPPLVARVLNLDVESSARLESYRWVHGSGAFTVSTSVPWPRYLSPGRSETLTIEFKPTAAGAVSDTLRLNVQMGGAPSTIDLVVKGEGQCVPQDTSCIPTRAFCLIDLNNEASASQEVPKLRESVEPALSGHHEAHSKAVAGYRLQGDFFLRATGLSALFGGVEACCSKCQDKKQCLPEVEFSKHAASSTAARFSWMLPEDRTFSATLPLLGIELELVFSKDTSGTTVLLGSSSEYFFDPGTEPRLRYVFDGEPAFESEIGCLRTGLHSVIVRPAQPGNSIPTLPLSLKEY